MLMLVNKGESLENEISFVEYINDSDLQLIGSFDVFKVCDSHLRFICLIRQLLHLLLDRVHPEADHD